MSRLLLILLTLALFACHALAKDPAQDIAKNASTAPQEADNAKSEEPVSRTWTSTSGATVDATFERLNGALVVLKLADGSGTMIRVSELSKEDQDYVRATEEKRQEELKKKREALKTSRTSRLSKKSSKKTEKAEFWNDVENDVLAEMNCARTKPKEFAEFLKKYKASYEGDNIFVTPRGRMRTQEGLAAVDEAIEFLEEVEPVKELKASKGLSLAAEAHADDVGKAGITGHVGTDDSTMKDRINKQGKWKVTIGENISFGPKKGRDIVMQLIVDDGVPGRGHRKNIYNDRFGVAGIAFRNHKKYGKCCVIDYAGGFSD